MAGQTKAGGIRQLLRDIARSLRDTPSGKAAFDWRVGLAWPHKWPEPQDERRRD